MDSDPGSQTAVLSERFEEALLFAYQLHSGQIRKVDRVPYISHVLGVTS